MNELVVFDEISATLAKYKVENEKLVFDYADKEGAKQAKSQIMKLRKVKTGIGDIHKKAKAEALEFGRLLDGKKRELIGEVEKMIAVHKEPLDVIEAEIVAKAMAEIEKREEEDAKKLADLEAREAAVREKEEEFAREKAEAERIEREKIAEAERVERERIAEHERIKREKRIAEEAAEAARIQAEQKAKAEADAKELAEKKRQEVKEVAEKKRIENKKHRKKVEDEAHLGLTKTGHLGNVEASEVLLAIMESKIPHVSINY